MDTTGLISTTTLELAARVMALVASVALCVLSFLEHGRSVAPSTILTVFLVFGVFCDFVQAGLYYVAKNLCHYSPLTAAIFAVKLVVLGLESQNKTSILREPYQNLAPEERAGFFGNAFFWWVNKVISLGYQKVLTAEDMPPLASYMDTMKMREQLQRTWDNRSNCYMPLFELSY